MRESLWGVAVLTLSFTVIAFIYFFQNLSSTQEHNYYLLQETTQAAMIDAIDIASYRQSGTIKIVREKFVESFVRRFAENADASVGDYKIEIYDINEEPPKVSIKIISVKQSTVSNEIVTFDLVDKVDAILETPY